MIPIPIYLVLLGWTVATVPSVYIAWDMTQRMNRDKLGASYGTPDVIVYAWRMAYISRLPLQAKLIRGICGVLGRAMMRVGILAVAFSLAAKAITYAL